MEKLATGPPRNFGDDSKKSLDWAVRQHFQIMKLEVPAEVVSALQLLRLPEAHQTFLQRLQKNDPKATSTPEAAEDLLASIGLDKLNEAEVSNALLFMVLSLNARQYNPSHLISTIRSKSRVKQLDWQLVIRGFDLPALQISSDQFMRLFESLIPLASDEQNFDIQGMWGGRWKHPETQLSFLKAFLFCPPEQLDISRIPGFRHGFPADLFEGASEDLTKKAELALKNQLSSADAVTAIFDLVLPSDSSPSTPDCQDILNHFIQNHLATFILSAPGIPEPWTVSQERFINKCFNVFLLKQSSEYPFALEGLWRNSRDWVFKQMHYSFLNDPMISNNILECAQQFGWTDSMLSIVHPLTLDIACLLHRDHEFDIENWLRESAEQQTAEHIGSTLTRFLKIKSDDEYRVQRKQQPSPRSVSLAVKTVFALLLVVEDFINDHESLTSIHRECLATYPRLINYGEGFDDIIDENGRDGNGLPEEADQQMSELFGRMYRDELSFREVLELMREFKTSHDPAKQDLFTCIVAGLFDEYHSFHEYPSDALMKTAVMFGGIINFKLISGIPLKVGLSLILDAVRDNQRSDPTYKFGVEAIEQLTGRLPEWVEFCRVLVQIPSLQGTTVHKKALDVIREQGHDVYGERDANGVNGVMDPLSLTNGNIDELLSTNNAPRRFRSLHADPPAKGVFKDPDQVAQDKVLFVLNNISNENLTTKLKDLQDVLRDEHYQWFASHLVEQRAKLEPNFQPLYMSLLEMIGDKALMAEVLRETYVSAIRMMNAEATINSATERGQLKNLGGWLGSLTIAKDKPIKHKNIFFRDLLLEGLDTQRLLVVIPFTCKVLVQGARSTVFKPPNPWLMDILSLLMELYHYADLKLNLKFEIEVLCKDLGLDHKTVDPSACIQDRPPQADDELANISGMPDGLDVGFDDLSLGGLSRGVRNERLSPATIMSSLPRLEDVLKYPSTGGADYDLVKDIVYRAFDQAIQEIIAPVVERSITIASISTAQLIQKDFACEVDGEKMRSAARQMVKSLAGSLALVTCKEPLKMSITNYIRRPAHLDPTEQPMSEGVIMMCVNDNIDTACSFVEKAAEERSIPEIDRVIEPDLEERRRHLAHRPNEPFVSDRLNRWALFIPEPFRQGAGGLNDAQLAIYEDFARQVKGANTNHSQNASSDSTGRQLPDVLQEPFTMPNLSTPAEPPALPHQTPQMQQESRMHFSSMPTSSAQPQTNGFGAPLTPQDKILNLIYTMQAAASQSSVDQAKNLPKASSIIADFGQILHIITSSARPTGENLARLAAEKVCSLLFKGVENQLEAELLALLLARICQLSELVSRDVFRWLSTHEEAYILNVSTIFALVSVGLLDLARIDMVLAKFINLRKLQALTVLAQLMDLVLFSDAPIALRADFASSLEVMNQWLSEDPALELAHLINNRLRDSGVPEALATAPDDKALMKKDQMQYIFKEWIKMYQNSGSTERLQASFLRDMHQKQVINNQEDSAVFFRLCLDTCVDAFDHEAESPNPSLDNAYIHTDGLAKLIICLIKLQGEANGAVKIRKGPYLKSILSIIVLVENHHQVMRGVHFNQRVFYRLFSSLLCEYSANGLHRTAENEDMMLVFAETFLALQPAHIPGFAYGWLGLLSHRGFMPGLLNLPSEAGWEQYSQLMQVMLRYVGELLTVPGIQVAEHLYKGALRIMLLLHSDFPEFLAENYVQLCNAIPAHLVQLRNLVLCALPQSIAELPDQFTPGLKVDRLDEMKKAPIIAGNIMAPLERDGLKDVIDKVLQKGSNLDDGVSQIRQILYNPPASHVGPIGATGGVDMSELNALVLYIGQEALALSPGKFDPSSPHSELLHNLAQALRPEARYQFLNAVANHIRYPNTHTNYFSKALLHIFGTERVDQQDSEIRQQIVCVILERLIGHRPHPWGIAIVFMELERNPHYKFWDLPFMAAAPDVRHQLSRIFKSSH